MGSMSMNRLAREIHNLRTYVRGKYRDIRANTTVTADLLQYVENLPRVKKHPGEIAAAEEFEADEPDQRSRKRRREEEKEDATYLGGGLDKGDNSDVIENLRSKKKSATKTTKTTNTVPTPVLQPQTQYVDPQQFIAPAPSFAPPPISMDAPYPTVAPPAYTTQTLRNQLNQQGYNQYHYPGHQ